MARKEDTETTENTEVEAAEATTDNRSVMIEDPATGEQVKRAEWIRKVFLEEGGEFYGNRGAIAKKLTEIQGKKVPYQIVFQATSAEEYKAVANKVKAAKAEAAEAAAAAEQEAEPAEA